MPSSFHVFQDDALGTSAAMDLTQRLRRREVSLSEVTEAAIERAKKADEALHTHTHSQYEQALNTSHHETLVDTPFSGIPTLIKDNQIAKGFETGFGSAAVTPKIETKDDPFIRQFRALGFNVLGNGSAAGLAFINSNGIAQYVGSNLLTFSSGWETIASVVAHEIGHNLGLDHNTINQNLMGSGSGVIDGERLNASQLANVLESRFVVAAAPVPVPAAVWLLLSALAGLFSKFHINTKFANEDQALHAAMHPA